LDSLWHTFQRPKIRIQEEFQKQEEAIQAKIQEAQNDADRMALEEAEKARLEKERIAREHEEKLAAIPDFIKLRSAYQNNLKEHQDKYDKQKMAWTTQYKTMLKKQYDFYRGEGQLDEVLAIKKEMERFKADGDWPKEVNEDLPDEVKTTQSKVIKLIVYFDLTLEEDLDKVKDEYASQLLELTKKLTQAGKTEEAILLRKIHNNLLFGTSETSSTEL